MGKALRGAARVGRGRGGAAADRGGSLGRPPVAPAADLACRSGDPRSRRLTSRIAPLVLLLLALLVVLPGTARALRAQDDAPPAGALRLDRGRFTVVAYPQDAALARSLLAAAGRRDTFPGLPRPAARVLIAVAPDEARFRQWIGPSAPEWGAAVAFPSQMRIVMQGRRAGSDAGDPEVVLRHEIAHLALHERLGPLPPRWFDEGYASYAAGEWGREELLATNAALVLRRFPSLATLDSGFYGGSLSAQASYALAHRAVDELASLDPERGLTLFFQYWKESGSLDRAVRAAYGVTLSAFEQRWQQRTRLRYGALAAVADVALASSILLLPLLPLWIARRRRDRRRMAALVAADAEAERRAAESALDALLGEAGPADARAPGPAP